MTAGSTVRAKGVVGRTEQSQPAPNKLSPLGSSGGGQHVPLHAKPGSANCHRLDVLAVC